MTKAAPKLTKIQTKALAFIRTSLERSGTAPTLRELCAYMGYSAIGSAQDLVAALRRKGFLHTPDKQSARSLVLTPKAIALQEPTHQSTGTTYVIHCFSSVPQDDDLSLATESRVGTLRMSVSMFSRPYPDPQAMYGIRAADESMVDAGIFKGDWLVVNVQKNAEPGQIIIAKIPGAGFTLKRLMKDRHGEYLKPENTAYSIIRQEPSERSFAIVGRVIAVQRVLDTQETSQFLN